MTIQQDSSNRPNLENHSAVPAIYPHINNDLEAALIPQPPAAPVACWQRQSFKVAAYVCVAVTVIVGVPMLLSNIKSTPLALPNFPGICDAGYSADASTGWCVDNFFGNSYQFMREFLATNSTLIPGPTLQATCCPQNSSLQLNHVCCPPSPYQDFRYYSLTSIVYTRQEYSDEYVIQSIIAKDELQAREFFQEYLLGNETSYTGIGLTCISQDKKDGYCAMSGKDKFTTIHPDQEPWKSSNSTSVFNNIVEMKRFYRHPQETLNSISNWFSNIKSSLSSFSLFAGDAADKTEPQNEKIVVLDDDVRMKI